MVASSEDAGKALSQYIELLKQAILQANEEQKTALTPSARAKMPKRAISTVMNALVCHGLRANLTGLPGINITEKHAQTRITFSSTFLMKCKQSRRKRINFISTQSMMDFMHQVQAMFPGMPSPVTNIVLTYEWNETRTEIINISIQCPADKKNCYWIQNIPLEATPQATPMVQSQSPPDLPTEEKRIVPKPKRMRKSQGAKKSKKGLNKDNGKQGQTSQS